MGGSYWRGAAAQRVWGSGKSASADGTKWGTVSPAEPDVGIPTFATAVTAASAILDSTANRELMRDALQHCSTLDFFVAWSEKRIRSVSTRTTISVAME
jgi:hypothetical protein